MVINLFDSNFQGSPCSVAFQQSRYTEYIHQQMDFDGVTLFTDEWINSPVVDQVQSRHRVGWLHEPYCLHPETYQSALVNMHKFDFILTYDADLLYKFPDRFCFAPYAGTWVNRRDWGIKPKTKLCSMLIGSKMSTDGHRIRHEIADMIEGQGYEVDFYGTRGQPASYGQETKRRVLADYHFAIVTETCREDNLFTEWLLDCFALGTIPIFWGAPNIGQYFDPKGILQFDTVDRLQKILAGLNTEQWVSRMSSVYLNLLKMGEYAVTEDWIYLNVLRDLR